MRCALLLVCGLASLSCVSEEERRVLPPQAIIERVVPEKIMAGHGFQVQPNGESAISVAGANLGRGCRIRLNGQALETSSGNGKTLSAVVPSHLYSRAGKLAVTVDQPDGRVSNSLPFIVLPSTGPKPCIAKLYPATTVAGHGFNLQANGEAALGLTGTNFLPGAKVLFNNVELTTVFGDVDSLGAVVPASLFHKPAVVNVVVRNMDGKMSAPAKFRITKK